MRWPVAACLAAGEQLGRLERHRGFFIRAHHEEAHARVRNRDVGHRVRHAHPRLAIAVFIEQGTQELEALQAAVPDQRAVLADAPGERHGVDPAHDRGVGAEILANAMGVQADGQPASFIARGSALLDVVHVRGSAQACQAGALVE